ncbi:hypothetical protein [Arthrobacter antioxidans]|uniref:hypothetical protein n=1 Tax=Arthrobacter antioxidans TaxID=2895818 RepID=UPI001FFFC30D|nr:hypothetical protein [Arthrobacter antioxidans]
MSKANDTRATGSPVADHAGSGEPDMAARNSSTDVSLQDAPADDGGAVRVELPTRRQLRLQQVDGRAVAPDPATDQRVDVVRAPLPGGRRDRRRRSDARVASDPTAPGIAGSGVPAPGVTADGTAVPPSSPRRAEDMSVEEALAARQSIGEDASEHLAGLRAAGAEDPFVVDPGVLAQQKALADRAAALNSRARRPQEPSVQNQQRTPPPIDPTAAHNLSIIAPPALVRVPGSAQSVLRAPATTHIPIVLPRPEPSAALPVRTGESDSGGVEGPDPRASTQPIGARDAFGLDPLDAMTAGLGRLRRVRYLQYSLLVVGATALATGIIMTVSSLNG